MQYNVLYSIKASKFCSCIKQQNKNLSMDHRKAWKIEWYNNINLSIQVVAQIVKPSEALFYKELYKQNSLRHLEIHPQKNSDCHSHFHSQSICIIVLVESEFLEQRETKCYSQLFGVETKTQTQTHLTVHAQINRIFSLQIQDLRGKKGRYKIKLVGCMNSKF